MGFGVLADKTPSFPAFHLMAPLETPRTYLAFIGGMHLLCLAAPFTFSWSMVGLFLVGYFITGGSTLTTPSWLFIHDPLLHALPLM